MELSAEIFFERMDKAEALFVSVIQKKNEEIEILKTQLLKQKTWLTYEEMEQVTGKRKSYLRRLASEERWPSKKEPGKPKTFKLPEIWKK